MKAKNFYQGNHELQEEEHCERETNLPASGDSPTGSPGTHGAKYLEQFQSEDQTGQEGEESDIIFPEKDRYPYCIVWTALPIITWFLPFIGHTGISTAEGVIHDFAGPYYISVDDFAFGAPLKYMRLDASKIGREKWNRSLLKADKHYEGQMHNICCNNCHSHVAYALNEMEYLNKKDWTMVSVWFLTVFKSRYVSYRALLKTYLPFAFFFIIFLLFRK